MYKKILFFVLIFITSQSQSREINEDTFIEIISANQFYSASFKQITINQQNQEREVTGIIKANRSGKFRLDYNEPVNEILIFNGQELYRFDPDLKQVDIRQLDSSINLNAITFFLGKKSDISDLYGIDGCNEEKRYCQLSPKNTDSYIKYAKITLSKESFIKLEYEDLYSQKVIMFFENVSHEPISSKNFEFIYPKGIDVVRY